MEAMKEGTEHEFYNPYNHLLVLLGLRSSSKQSQDWCTFSVYPQARISFWADAILNDPDTDYMPEEEVVDVVDRSPRNPRITRSRASSSRFRNTTD